MSVSLLLWRIDNHQILVFNQPMVNRHLRDKSGAHAIRHHLNQSMQTCGRKWVNLFLFWLADRLTPRAQSNSALFQAEIQIHREGRRI